MTYSWLNDPSAIAVLDRLVPHDAVPWGHLQTPYSAQQVLEQLHQQPPTLRSDLSHSGLLVYHSRELGVANVTRVGLQGLQKALVQGQLDPQLLVRLHYRHGNLWCYLFAEELPAPLLVSQDVYLLVHQKTHQLVGTHIGEFNWHHQLYDYLPLHGKQIPLGKWVASKRFNSIMLDNRWYDPLEGIPY